MTKEKREGNLTIISKIMAGAGIKPKDAIQRYSISASSLYGYRTTPMAYTHPAIAVLRIAFYLTDDPTQFMHILTTIIDGTHMQWQGETAVSPLSTVLKSYKVTAYKLCKDMDFHWATIHRYCTDGFAKKSGVIPVLYFLTQLAKNEHQLYAWAKILLKESKENHEKRYGNKPM